MIIGRDLLNELGIILDLKNNTITWDKAELIMRTYPSNNMTSNITETWFLDTTKETTIRMNDDGIYPLSNNSTKNDKVFFQEKMQQLKDTNQNKSMSCYMTKQTSTKSLQDARTFQDNNNNNSTSCCHHTPPCSTAY